MLSVEPVGRCGDRNCGGQFRPGAQTGIIRESNGLTWCESKRSGGWVSWERVCPGGPGGSTLAILSRRPDAERTGLIEDEHGMTPWVVRTSSTLRGPLAAPRTVIGDACEPASSRTHTDGQQPQPTRTAPLEVGAPAAENLAPHSLEPTSAPAPDVAVRSPNARCADAGCLTRRPRGTSPNPGRERPVRREVASGASLTGHPR
jgi:hypothetical protein